MADEDIDSGGLLGIYDGYSTDRECNYYELEEVGNLLSKHTSKTICIYYIIIYVVYVVRSFMTKKGQTSH